MAKLGNPRKRVLLLPGPGKGGAWRYPGSKDFCKNYERMLRFTERSAALKLQVSLAHAETMHALWKANVSTETLHALWKANEKVNLERSRWEWIRFKIYHFKEKSVYILGEERRVIPLSRWERRCKGRAEVEAKLKGSGRATLKPRRAGNTEGSTSCVKTEVEAVDSVKTEVEEKNIVKTEDETSGDSVPGTRSLRWTQLGRIRLAYVPLPPLPGAVSLEQGLCTKEEITE